MAREEPGEHGAPTHAPRSQETLRQVELSPQRAANERAGVARVRIVVVDDDRATTAMMRALLEHAGYDVETAHDGQAALDTIARFHPRVVLLDIGMPGMDGLAIARQLRQEQGGSELVLIAISGYSQGEHAAATRAAGFDQHLVKPVDLSTLRRVIAAATSTALPRA